MIIPAPVLRALIDAAHEARQVILAMQEASEDDCQLALRLQAAIEPARKFLEPKP